RPAGWRGPAVRPAAVPGGGPRARAGWQARGPPGGRAPAARERMERDFVGYADSPPVVPWPGGARLAVQVSVSYEEGAEYSLLDGPRRETMGEVPSPVPPDQRDLFNESFFEYGSRVGVWRLLEIC